MIPGISFMLHAERKSLATESFAHRKEKKTNESLAMTRLNCEN